MRASGFIGLLLSVTIAAASLLAFSTMVYAAPAVKIGVLTDMSGTYAAMGGPGSVAAAQMAIDDCLANECKGMEIELISADNQNKADLGAATAREWFDRRGVTAIADLTNSSVAIAVQNIAREKNKIALFSGPATTALTNDDCSPLGFHWMFDTYALSAVGVKATLEDGGDKWYFLTVDYAFGHSLEKETEQMVNELGGEIAGKLRHPLNNSDYASFLLQAQSSGANVVALANGVQDTINSIKQAKEFGVGGDSQRLVALLIFLSDLQALGNDVAQGLTYVDGFYWDYDDETRAFSERFGKAFRDQKPTMTHAGVYSSVMHYLKAVAATESVEGDVVAAKMREIPIQDEVMRNAEILPNGRVIHDMYLYKVKSPAEQAHQWDVSELLATIPAAEAFEPLERTTCKLQ